MVYIIIDGDSVSKVMLVKADSKEEVEQRLHLKETERFVGSLTDNEIGVLYSSSFVMLTS